MAEGEPAVSISEAGPAPPPLLPPSQGRRVGVGALWLLGEFLHPSVALGQGPLCSWGWRSWWAPRRQRHCLQTHTAPENFQLTRALSFFPSYILYKS